MPATPPQPFGILFPSPREWPLIPIAASSLNLLLIAACSLLLYITNKSYGIVKSQQPLWTSFFLPLMCGNTMISGHLTASPVVVGMLLITMAPLLASYRARNSTRDYFFMATCLSVGAMFQVAFVPFILAVIAGGFVMKSLRFKELCAIGLGLVAPFWVLFGLGIVSPFSANFPPVETIFTASLGQGMSVMVIGAGAGLLAGLVLALNNGIKLYAGNAGIRSYNNVINIFGITAVLAMMFDINNVQAYTGVFALWLSNQMAHLFTLWKFNKPRLIYWLIQATIGGSALLLLFYAM